MITDNEKFIEIQAILVSSNINTRDCAKINDLIIELSKENKELKEKYENAVADYETTMVERNELKKQLTTYQILHRDCKVDNLKNISKIEEMENQQKEFISYLENEKDRLARECSHIYENSLGKTRLVNEDIFNEVDTILSKYKSIIGVANEKNNN